MWHEWEQPLPGRLYSIVFFPGSGDKKKWPVANSPVLLWETKKTPRLIHVLKWHILPFPLSCSGAGKQVSKQTALWQTSKRKHLEVVQKLITPNTGKLGEKPRFFQLTQMPAVGSGTWLWEAAGINCICTSPERVFLLKQNTAADVGQCVHLTQRLSGLIVDRKSVV